MNALESVLEHTLALNIVLEYLSKREVLLLSSISSSLHKHFIKTAEDNYFFRFPPNASFKSLSPRKAILSTLGPYPPFITHLSFSPYFNTPIPSLPSTITHLSLGSNYNHQLSFHFPPNLSHLTLSDSFNYDVDNLPASLQYLKTGECFSQPVDHLPPSLKYLFLGTEKYSEFNSPVDYLPPSLTHLTFGNIFNNAIDHLPAGLLHLSLGKKFNKMIEHLPLSLVTLTIGDQYNQSLDHLPDSLLKLTLQGTFSSPAFLYGVDYLPPNITHLKLERMLKGNTADYLPKNLVELTLMIESPPILSQPLKKLNLTASFVPPLPLLLQELQFTALPPADALQTISIDFLPPITKLTISGQFQPHISMDNLPDSLLELTLGYKFAGYLNNLPPCLTHLTLHSTELDSLSYFNHPLDNLPASLLFLQLCDSFNQRVDHLPEGLREIHFGKMFNQPLDYLPRSLRTVSIGKSFSHSFPRIMPFANFITFHSMAVWNGNIDHLPPSVTKLILPDKFNDRITKLPPALESLVFGESFDHAFDLREVTSLKEIIFGSQFAPAAHEILTLPPTLTHISFGDYASTFNRPLDFLPPALTHLKFPVRSKFNHDIESLPVNLVHLLLGNGFCSTICPLPLSLVLLRVTLSFQHKLQNLSPFTEVIVDKKLAPVEPKRETPAQPPPQPQQQEPIPKRTNSGLLKRISQIFQKP